MLAVTDKHLGLSTARGNDSSNRDLHLESTLEDLTLYEFEIDVGEPGQELAKEFTNNSLMPGAILKDSGKFVGMISRRRFLEHLSRPYGIELFSRRPLEKLYHFVETELSVFPSNTLVVMAARRSLERSPELLYEPIVVQLNSCDYRLLDVHQLLVAQSQIHELTTKMLHEQTRSHMIQTEKMASLGRMVAGLAHEIKNPINCIWGNMGFLANYSQDLLDLLAVYEGEIDRETEAIVEKKEEVDLDFLKQDLPKILGTVRVAAERLTKMVGGMQNFSHMDETTRKPADLHECLDSTLLILENRLKYEIEVVKQYDELPLVECYSGQLSQVFTNIISNAIDALLDQLEATQAASPENSSWKPRIEIETKIRESNNSQPWVSVCIRDNGPGIPKEIQQRIFQNFFTTKPVGKGTGLGLAISNEIVKEKHGGRLNLKSEPGWGTQFEIVLPVSSSECHSTGRATG
ncbi:MAG: ATP-binding protein [Cyanobacteria bacterium J007]|nr:MAG: ATP-binding protein [Cyanobacteria bacterium J007]